ncbi:MAG: transposase [Planctomycetota bacterium]
MPVHLFTFHAHGSWMPDRPEGFVQRKRGVLPTDSDMALAYRSRQTKPDATFTLETREAMITVLRDSAVPQNFELHAIATDPSHIHALIAWHDDRTAVRMRQKLKESLTRSLNQRFDRRTWFGRGGHDRRVRDRTHFDHLRNTYLPGHAGPNWFSSDR